MRAANAAAQGEKWMDIMVGGAATAEVSTILPDPVAARPNAPSLHGPVSRFGQKRSIATVCFNALHERRGADPRDLAQWTAGTSGCQQSVRS